MRPKADVKTTRGTFVIELFAKAARNTVRNFVYLGRRKFYDGLAVHRSVPFFLVQTGDPHSRAGAEDPGATGTGTPGHAIASERTQRRMLYSQSGQLYPGHLRRLQRRRRRVLRRRHDLYSRPLPRVFGIFQICLVKPDRISVFPLFMRDRCQIERGPDVFRVFLQDGTHIPRDLRVSLFLAPFSVRFRGSMFDDDIAKSH